MKNRLKDKLRPSDRQLDLAIRWSQRLSVVSTSGAGVWGGIAVLGGAALLLNMAGAGIPAIIGFSTVVTGSVLALKALTVRGIYKIIHKKSVKAKETRIREREAKAAPLAPSIGNSFNAEATPALPNFPLPPVPGQPSALAKKPAARLSFNPKAALAQIRTQLDKVHLPKFTGKTPKPA